MGTCEFTPEQARTFATTWRMDPSFAYNNAGYVTPPASPDAQYYEQNSANYTDHLATSSTSEVLKEVATLLELSNYINGEIARQQAVSNMLNVLQASNSVSQAKSELQVKTLQLNQLVDAAYAANAVPAGASASGD